jgi:hypothetical protein
MVAFFFLEGSVQRPKFDEVFLVVAAVGIHTGVLLYTCNWKAQLKSDLRSYMIHVLLLFHHFHG